MKNWCVDHMKTNVSESHVPLLHHHLIATKSFKIPHDYYAHSPTLWYAYAFPFSHFDIYACWNSHLLMWLSLKSNDLHYNIIHITTKFRSISTSTTPLPCLPAPQTLNPHHKYILAHLECQVSRFSYPSSK